MIKEKTTKFEVSDYLNSKEDIRGYLTAVLEYDSQDLFLHAIGDVIKSKGFTKISKNAGVTREGLYKSFSGKTKTKFETVYKVLDSLGFKFDIVPKQKALKNA
jgi:probable addiction module antidote protein